MFLLDKGANPHVWDMSGRTPIYVAVDMKSFNGRWRLWWRSRGTGPRVCRRASGAAQHRHRAWMSINRLLDMGVDINHQLTRKRPYGAGRGRFADYDLRGGVGPLFVATMRHDHESMQALLAHGAEVDLRQCVPDDAADGGGGHERHRSWGRWWRTSGRGAGRSAGARHQDHRPAAGCRSRHQYRVIDSRTHTAKLMAYVAGPRSGRPHGTVRRRRRRPGPGGQASAGTRRGSVDARCRRQDRARHRRAPPRPRHLRELRLGPEQQPRQAARRPWRCSKRLWPRNLQQVARLRRPDSTGG